MRLLNLIGKLMTEEELATSRIGILGATSNGLTDYGAESVILAPFGDGFGPACELILAEVSESSLAELSTAVRRLSRDGMLVAAVPASLTERAVAVIAECGIDWVAILESDGPDYFVVAARDIHPDEIGPLLTDHVVHPARSTCLRLPQNRLDRARRRYVRRHGRDRMLALAGRLRNAHGDSVRRVVTGIEILVAERAPKLDTGGRQPGMFTVPDLEIEPWPDPVRSARLKRLIDICDRYGRAVSVELREMVAGKSFSAYLDDEYNKNKFQMDDTDSWQAVRLIDWRNQVADLPAACRATRQLLSELGTQISGEVNILRVAPKTSLPPHYDDYDCEQYIHIGVTVPAECGIRVAGEARTWENGKPIVFSPAFLHEVWNHSDKPRDVLAIDTWHTDLSDVEVDAVCQVRSELEALRRERQERDRQR